MRNCPQWLRITPSSDCFLKRSSVEPDLSISPAVGNTCGCAQPTLITKTLSTKTLNQRNFWCFLTGGSFPKPCPYLPATKPLNISAGHGTGYVQAHCSFAPNLPSILLTSAIHH